MGDWLADEFFGWTDITYRYMKEYYLSLPNAHERASETLKILLKYNTNTMLYPYTITIKALLGVLTVDDIDRNHNYSIEFIHDLLDNGKYDILDKLITYIGKIALSDYVFMDIAALRYVLTRPNVHLGKFCNVVKVLTLPLIAEVKNFVQGRAINKYNYEIFNNWVNDYFYK